MTSASELFHNRRSRLGRNTNELGFESPLPRIFHDNHRNHRHHSGSGNGRRGRLDLDGCNTLRGSAPTRHPIHRPSLFLLGNDSARFDLDGSLPLSGNITSLDNISFLPIRQPLTGNDLDESHPLSGNITSLANISFLPIRQPLTGNDNLPGPVLLARERLLQRLRGDPVAGNSRASPGIRLDDDYGLMDDSHLETEISWERLTRATPLTHSTIPSGQQLMPRRTRMMGRPRGLSQEAFNSLHAKTFGNADTGDEGKISRTSNDCSICLDCFMYGDKLIYLPCGHRFHSSCLYPWVQICGDCPHCRTGIVNDSSDM